MVRLQRVALLWNWLPAFRAVAEVGGIRRAAALIGTSPSALSRSITLLEAEVGTTLFDRIGAKLTLTRAGEDLLARVRAAMRGIDEALPAAAERRPMLLLGTNARWLEDVLVKVALDVATKHPEATVETALVSAEQAAEGLLSGRVDVVLSTKPIAHEAITELGSFQTPLALVGASAHPLAGRSAEEVLRGLSGAAFVVPPSDVDLDADDGWTSGPRVIRLAVPTLRDAFDACAAGLGLAMVPARELRERARQGAGVVEIAHALPARSSFVYGRKPVGPTPLVDHAVTALGAQLIG